MASTITAATMTVTLTEDITLNGSNQGATNTLTIAGVNEIYKRIVTVTTTEADILDFAAAVAAGQFIIANVRYIRFTNKDDTNFVTLTFTNADGDEMAIKVDAGQSFIMNGDLNDGLTAVFNSTQNADADSDAALQDLTKVQADANTGSCDLEIFVASV